jgi:hypothetical protein
MGSGAEVELAEYNYNELGQLVKKNLHGNSSSRLQGIDYRYNIRGWLTSINNAKLNTDANNTLDGAFSEDDAFGEELTYNSNFVAGSTTGTAQWNGNISGMTWKSKSPTAPYSNTPVSAYAFQYDKVNRLTLAYYGSGANVSSWNDNPGRYNEALSYDVMGNIATLQRTGLGSNVDNLSYTYGTSSNKLLAVTNSSSTPVGFVDGNKSGNDYAYDENGKLITDNNKGLSINYNYLNLPSSVSSSSQGKTITYTYNYFLKDHLGNVRVVLTTDNSQSAAIYPAATMETAILKYYFSRIVL